MQTILLASIGLIAGLASGLFGIGGGVLIVPALVYILKFSMHRAIGTSLAVLLPPVGIAAVFTYYRAGNVDAHAAIIIAITLLTGAWFGALAAGKLDNQTLHHLFGAFLVILGIYTILAGKT